MAHVKDVVLSVIDPDKPKSLHFNVSFTVEFSPTERKMNLQFGVFILIHEVDHRPDMLIPIPNGFNALRIANIDPSLKGTKYVEDDFVGWMQTDTIRPNQRSIATVTFKQTFSYSKRRIHKERFRASVYVIPDISAGMAWSEPISLEKKDDALSEIKKDIG